MQARVLFIGFAQHQICWRAPHSQALPAGVRTWGGFFLKGNSFFLKGNSLATLDTRASSMWEGTGAGRGKE